MHEEACWRTAKYLPNTLIKERLMGISSIQALFITLTFIVPGFVIDGVTSKFICRKSRRPHADFLHFLTSSCINYAVFSGLVYLMLFGELTLSTQIVLLFIITFIGPAVIGLILAYAHQYNWVRWVAKKICLKIIHPTPTAWDYKFHLTGPAFIKVTLVDGSEIHGYFGTNSLASSDPKERDIFIEKGWRLEGEEWVEIPRSSGLLIASGNVKYIEFISGS